MKKTYFLFSLFFTSLVFSQTELPSQPYSTATNSAPQFGSTAQKAVGDSCGAYFNQYVGFAKTSLLYFESLRTGDGSDFTSYPGRGQRFHANQDIEISGIEFYSFHTNTTVDSFPVITVLYDYNDVSDTVGVELARDTVLVGHTAFDSFLPAISVQSYFDTPVTVNEDYIVALYTTTNDSLKIITNSAADNDGAGEGVSFAYYDNPAAPSFTGWYPTLPTFGPIYDIDFLINPLVHYQLNDGFTLSEDNICPVSDSTCANYQQVPVFADPHYNSNSTTPFSNINWAWGDDSTTVGMNTGCHKYNSSGTYNVSLKDTLNRYNFTSNICPFEVVKSITVLDSIEISSAEAIYTATDGLSADFTGVTNITADSVAWNFGDGAPISSENPVTHIYDAEGTYTAWFYAYGPCNTDSAMTEITVFYSSIEENETALNFYPNPANSAVTIENSYGNVQIELVNIMGEIIFTTYNSDKLVTIPTVNLATGTYFIRVQNDDNYYMDKLMIKH